MDNGIKFMNSYLQISGIDKHSLNDKVKNRKKKGNLFYWFFQYTRSFFILNIQRISTLKIQNNGPTNGDQPRAS